MNPFAFGLEFERQQAIEQERIRQLRAKYEKANPIDCWVCRETFEHWDDLGPHYVRHTWFQRVRASFRRSR